MNTSLYYTVLSILIAFKHIVKLVSLDIEPVFVMLGVGREEVGREEVKYYYVKPPDTACT